MTEIAYVGLDHDGLLTSCASVVGDQWEESFFTHVAIEISGAKQAAGAVFQTGHQRFRTREEDSLRALAASSIEDAASHRVRTLQALLDRPALSDGRPVRLALGLPVHRFFKDLETGVPDAEFQRQWLADQDIEVVRDPMAMPVNVVMRNVASRGIAAYFDWTRDKSGRLRVDREADVTTVLDVGARDTTLLTFTANQLKTDQCARFPLGYLSVLEHLDKALQTEFKVPPVRARVLLAILIEGAFHHHGHKHEAAPLLEPALLPLVRDIQAAMEQLDALAQDTVVVGSAAAAIAAALSRRGQAVQVPVGPAFANARGMAKFLRGIAQ